MGHRLTKIYTRTGDKGTTGIGGGKRVDKDCLSVEVSGTIDELNSYLGLVLAYAIRSDLNEDLTEIQHLLFDLGSDLRKPDQPLIKPEHTLWLEQRLDRLNEDLPWLKEFILPGGDPAAACCHVARAVSRRAERLLVALAKVESVHADALAFINRLSDYLFVAARTLARAADSERLWRGRNRHS